jgi:sugar phosphate isomerase/epimerase
MYRLPQAIDVIDLLRQLERSEKSSYPRTIGFGGAPTTEIGKGKIDWRAGFEAARKAHIEHYFVERESPFSEMPPLEAIKVSCDHLHALNV